MMLKLRSLLRNKKGQALIEYGILVGGVALISLAATALLGHKTGSLIGTVAGALPCAHDEDVGPVQVGRLVALTTSADGGIVLDATTTGTIGDYTGIPGLESLVLD